MRDWRNLIGYPAPFTDKGETGEDERRLLETVIESALQQLGSLIDGGRDEFRHYFASSCAQKN